MQKEAFGLIEVPEEFLEAQQLVHEAMHGNIDYFGILMFDPVNIIILSKLLMIATMQLTKKPIFTEGCTELENISVQELEHLKKEEILDSALDMQYDFFFRCLTIMDSLSMYGWKRLDDLRFGAIISENGVLRHEEYSNTHLKTYYEYFDNLVDHEKEHLDVSTHVYTFVNERLGKYQKYMETHVVDEQLQIRITEELSHIIELFGASQCVHSVKEYGYEIVYIHSYDLENEDESFCYDCVDFLMPVHAANLEKLLDIAFERYPIESEEITYGKHIESGSTKNTISAI